MLLLVIMLSIQILKEKYSYLKPWPLFSIETVICGEANIFMYLNLARLRKLCHVFLSTRIRCIMALRDAINRSQYILMSVTVDLNNIDYYSIYSSCNKAQDYATQLIISRSNLLHFNILLTIV